MSSHFPDPCWFSSTQSQGSGQRTGTVMAEASFPVFVFILMFVIWLLSWWKTRLAHCKFSSRGCQLLIFLIY